MSKKNNFLKNINYLYKKKILIPFLDKSKNSIEKNNLDKIEFISDTNEVLDKKLKKAKKEIFLIDLKNKLILGIKRLKPAKKELWIGEFRSFLITFMFILFLSAILIGGIDIVNDFKNLKINTVYAQDMLTSGIDDFKNSNITNAKNKFYLAFNSLYDINGKVTFITNLSISIYGKIINFTENDLNEVVRCFDNISTSLIKLSNDINRFNNENNLYKIKEVKNTFDIVYSNIKLANADIEKINWKMLPKEYQNEFLEYKQKLIDLQEITNNIYLSSDIASYVVGENSIKRILVIFENANELRATGGFMGSYALIDFKDGNITNYEVPGGGIYDLRAGFTKTLEPPEPFKILVSKWEIQDTNWFFDFKKSANKIIEFFEPSSRTSVDGLIVINSNIMSGIMDLVGDIKVDSYNTTFTKYNIIDELQNIIGSKRNKTNKPKLIIGDLFEKMSEQILNKKDFELDKMYNLFSQAIDKKQILAYFKDDGVESKIENLGISGEILDTKADEDYLAIVDTNIGGGKTSQYIDRNVQQKIDILDDGEVIKTLIINKKYIKQNNNFDNKNTEFTRIYVPEGSELISVYGFNDDVKINNDTIYANYDTDPDLKNLNELSVKDPNTNTIIYNDEGKTIFGNFLYLNPGEEKQIVIKYKLPFKVEFNNSEEYKYKIYLQKQSGIENLKYDVSININNGYCLIDGDKINTKTIILDKDKEIELTLIKK